MRNNFPLLERYRLLIVLLIGVIFFAILACTYVGKLTYNAGYEQSSSDYAATQAAFSNKVTNGMQGTYVQGHSVSGSTVRYGIASTDQSMLWGLDDPYNNQVVVASPFMSIEMPFGIPLVACTVYVVTVDDIGQQTIASVSTDEIPSKYDAYIAGCDPASPIPWWVKDQAEHKGEKPLPPAVRNVCDPIYHMCKQEGANELTNY